MIKFLIVSVISYLVLMQIFRASTYHKYFFFALPILVIYSIGLSLFFFNKIAPSFSTDYVILISIALLVKGLSDYFKSKKYIKLYQGDDKNLIKVSIASTFAYYTLSSLCHIIVFFVSYLNRTIVSEKTV